jgi:hypothetical protein
MNEHELSLNRIYVDGQHEGIKFAIKVLYATRDTMIACGINPTFPNGADFVEHIAFKLKLLVYENPWRQV